MFRYSSCIVAVAPLDVAKEETVPPKPPSVSKDKITAATLDLLRTRGPSAVTIDGVAARSGVARTTIYRWYSDRDDMLAAALLEVGTLTPPREALTGRERLEWVITHAAQVIVNGIGFGGMAALITDTDPKFTAAFRRVLRLHRTALADVIEEGVANGSLRAPAGVETFVDSIVGSLIAEQARTGEIAAGWEDRLLALYAPSTVTS